MDTTFIKVFLKSVKTSSLSPSWLQDSKQSTNYVLCFLSFGILHSMRPLVSCQIISQTLNWACKCLYIFCPVFHSFLKAHTKTQHAPTQACKHVICFSLMHGVINCVSQPHFHLDLRFSNIFSSGWILLCSLLVYWHRKLKKKKKKEAG